MEDLHSVAENGLTGFNMLLPSYQLTHGTGKVHARGSDSCQRFKPRAHYSVAAPRYHIVGGMRKEEREILVAGRHGGLANAKVDRVDFQCRITILFYSPRATLVVLLI